MDANILITKFYLPQPPARLVMRPSLSEKLNTGLEKPLTVVAAPAGFGKTTAVIQWIKQDLPITYTQRIVWLSLDERDSTTIEFWSYVIYALQSIQPRIGKVALNALQSSPRAPIENVLIALINDISAEPQPLLFCMDDYHLINKPEIHQSMEFFIDHLSPNFHLLLTTREDPPFSLARMRVQRQTNEIRASDLRFSETECAQFLNEISSLALDQSEIQALNQRTEGWVAGLQLAALSLQNAPDSQAFVADFAGSHRFITDYLVDEVLSRQSQQVQTFLLRTSLLERFNADICEQLIENVNCRKIINQLEQSNLFIVPLDNRRQWYRFHHLFTEFLQIHLRENEPQLISDLYTRIINWFSSQNLKREALQYALKAKKVKIAADLIEELAPEIIAHDNHMLLCEWVNGLPSDLIQERPFLCTYVAWANLIASDPESAKYWLELAETHTAQLNESRQTILNAYIAAHQAYIPLIFGNTENSIKLAQKAVKTLPKEDINLRARILITLGNAYIFSGDLQEAIAAFEETIMLAKRTENLSSAIFAYYGLVDVLRIAIRLNEAKARLQDSLDLCRTLAGSIQIPSNASIFKQLGVISRECGDFEMAFEYLHQSINLAREWHQKETIFVSLVELADTTRLLREYSRAENFFLQAKPLAKAISPWASSQVNAFQARLYFDQGKFKELKSWAKKTGLLNTTIKLDFEHFTEYPALVRFYLAQQDYPSAFDLMDRIIKQETETGRLAAVGYMHSLQILAFQQTGQEPAAQKAFDQLYEIAAPEKWVRPFLEDPEIMIPFLQGKPASPQRDSILKVLGDTPALVGTTPDQSTLIEPLNERELAILRQISSGSSNKEIGEQVYLSVNTIRWYASQIYMKLNVKSRTEAVAKARELGIL